MVGRHLRHYRVTEKLGSGGMGDVYKAEDTRLHRWVALKVLPPETANDHATLERFGREARAASALNHPNICTIYDVGEEDGRPFIAMEYVDGETLGNRIQGRSLPLDDVWAWGIQLADALEAAHQQGIVHRDVKPGNIMITRRGQAKILDFGLAKLVSSGSSRTAAGFATTLAAPESLTRPGTAMGTAAYMSPEQARGEELDGRADLFSLGAVLYEAVTGRRPFEGDTVATLFDAILNRPPIPPSRLNPQVPEALERVILAALEKRPEARPRSATSLRQELEEARRTPARKAAEGGAAERPSVAVLYLENLSGAREDEYFRDGMTEDITTEVTKVRSLHVFPRAAVASYRDRGAQAQEVGERLRATHVLGGSLRRAGDRLRVTVQLVETGSGHSVWAERYDREMKDVFAVQEDIARSIAQALRVSLSPGEERTIARKPTASLQAYDYFLRGRSYTTQQRRGFALEMFEHALALDPSFALAHAGIANVCAMQYYMEDHREEWITRAITACNRAFSLDPQLPEAFVARARILYAQARYDDAAEAARTAIALKPGCESSWDLLGRALFTADRWTEAADLVERALEANGDDYNVYVPYVNALNVLGRTEEARALRERLRSVLERQLEWVPEDSRARILLALMYIQLDQPEAGRRELERVLASGVTDPHSIYNGACTYCVLGMKREAMATLMRAVTAGYAEWDHLARDPDLACLHGEPEFERLLAGRESERRQVRK